MYLQTATITQTNLNLSPVKTDSKLRWTVSQLVMLRWASVHRQVCFQYFLNFFFLIFLLLIFLFFGGAGGLFFFLIFSNFEIIFGAVIYKRRQQIPENTCVYMCEREREREGDEASTVWKWRNSFNMESLKSRKKALVVERRGGQKQRTEKSRNGLKFKIFLK